MGAGAEECPVVAVTMGDPAGVGPELCLQVLADPAVRRIAVPVVFGGGAVLARVARQCGLAAPTAVIPYTEWPACPPDRLPQVVDFGLPDGDAVRPGVVSAACGRAAYTYIEAAIHAALAGQVAAIATAPIQKEALHAAGVPHPGHTEILADLTHTDRFCMMLASDDMAVSFVTTHLGYREVPARLTVERILEVIELTADAVGRLRGTPPRLAVCGLNPHAGEHGLFGESEEERIIAPAIAAAVEKGLAVRGPLPPDAAFLPSQLRQTDAIVCMYHDQGHAPFKMVAFDRGVNITLGLPIIRTSVDHGTAFDIAWQGVADRGSLVCAIDLAKRLSDARSFLRKTPDKA